MEKLFLNNAVISKGYGDDAAIRFGEKGGAFFTVGIPKFDKNAEGNTRWVNLNVKAFGDVGERVKTLKLNAGSRIAIEGDFDIDSFEKKDGTKGSVPVVIARTIEYAASKPADKTEKATETKETAGEDYPDDLPF